MTDQPPLPRLIERPHGSRLLTRTEAAELLGYSPTSMATVMGRDPDRWPRPAALLRRGRVWQMLWDADELLAAAPPATATQRVGSVATITGTDGILTCLECGRRFRSLGPHLASAHGITGAEYRDRHQLPATGALTADGIRQAGADRQRALLEADPTALDHLAVWQTPDWLDAMRETAIEVHHDTRSRDLVRAHRAPGQRYAVQVMRAARRALLDTAARSAGYPSIEDAIRATTDQPAPAAAARIGVSASTVRRWRRRLGATGPTVEGQPDRH